MAFKFETKFLKIGAILGGIAAVAGGVLGAVNLLTEKTIEANEIKAQEAALGKVFREADSYSDVTEIENDKHPYVLKSWTAFNATTEVGKIYFTAGKNAYGELSLMVGIKADRIANFAVVSNTQSYASTLEENYIGKFLADPENTNFEDIDTHCGATYGATLLKNMCLDALSLHMEGGK